MNVWKVISASRWPALASRGGNGYTSIFINWCLVCPYVSHCDLKKGWLFERLELRPGRVIAEPSWGLSAIGTELLMIDEARSSGYLFSQLMAGNVFGDGLDMIPQVSLSIVRACRLQVAAVLDVDTVVQYSLDSTVDATFGQSALNRILLNDSQALGPRSLTASRSVVLGLSDGREISFELCDVESARWIRLVDPIFVPFWVKV